MTAREMLAADGIPVAVVSLPCWELFAQQDDEYRSAVLGGVLRVGVEAAGDFGWDRILGPEGIFTACRGTGVGPSRGTIQAFWHYAGSSGRRGSQTSRLKKEEERPMTVSVAINGFGRIGRLVLRAIAEEGRTDLVPTLVNASNRMNMESAAHLFAYDSTHGRFAGQVELVSIR